MMNKGYLKGRRAEWRCMKTLEEKGYICVRGAGSHGIDIVAFLSKGNSWAVSLVERFDKPLIRAISVKAKKYVTSAEIREIKDAPLPNIVSKELWHYKPRAKGALII